MHNFIKILSVFLSALILAGCSTARVEYDDKSYQTDTITVDFKIPQISGLKNKDFESELNSDIENAGNEFLNKFESTAKNISHPSYFSGETSVYEKNGVLSLVTEINYYTQKPHNNSFRITKNINTETSELLSLGDLFADSGYIDFINHTLADMTLSNPDQYSGLWAKPVLSENQDFYISNDSVVIYYPPYELSYYTRGFVEFPIPLSALSGYLAEEYRSL